MKKSKGFTLIELLVVIAIIGILAAIVLVSLSGARNRAKDARIQADMAQIRSAAELYYSMNQNKYTDMSCATTDPNIKALCDDIDDQLGDPPGTENVTIIAGAQDYCAYTALNATGKFWCVDSTGRSKQYDAEPSGTCNAAGPSYTCE